MVLPGLRAKVSDVRLPSAVVYTAENHNHAAEILTKALASRVDGGLASARTQILNTVIGTMRLALGQGIQPVRYAQGAQAAVRQLAIEEGSDPDVVLRSLWSGKGPMDDQHAIQALIRGDFVCRSIAVSDSLPRLDNVLNVLV